MEYERFFHYSNVIEHGKWNLLRSSSSTLQRLLCKTQFAIEKNYKWFGKYKVNDIDVSYVILNVFDVEFHDLDNFLTIVECHSCIPVEFDPIRKIDITDDSKGEFKLGIARKIKEIHISTNVNDLKESYLEGLDATCSLKKPAEWTFVKDILPCSAAKPKIVLRNPKRGIYAYSTKEETNKRKATEDPLFTNYNKAQIVEDTTLLSTQPIITDVKELPPINFQKQDTRQQLEISERTTSAIEEQLSSNTPLEPYDRTLLEQRLEFERRNTQQLRERLSSTDILLAPVGTQEPQDTTMTDDIFNLDSFSCESITDIRVNIPKYKELGRYYDTHYNEQYYQSELTGKLSLSSDLQNLDFIQYPNNAFTSIKLHPEIVENLILHRVSKDIFIYPSFYDDRDKDQITAQFGDSHSEAQFTDILQRFGDLIKDIVDNSMDTQMFLAAVNNSKIIYLVLLYGLFKLKSYVQLTSLSPLQILYASLAYHKPKYLHISALLVRLYIRQSNLKQVPDLFNIYHFQRQIMHDEDVRVVLGLLNDFTVDDYNNITTNIRSFPDAQFHTNKLDENFDAHRIINGSYFATNVYALDTKMQYLSDKEEIYLSLENWRLDGVQLQNTIVQKYLNQDNIFEAPLDYKGPVTFQKTKK